MNEKEQQLSEQVEKLNARLTKAASVFKSQKADIERLTNERDEATSETENLKAKVKEFEERISEYSDIDAKMIEQATELSNLEIEFTKLKQVNADLRADLVESDEELEKYKSEKEALCEQVKTMFAQFKETAKTMTALVKDLGM